MLVNDKSIAGQTLADIGNCIIGPPGTYVNIGVARAADDGDVAQVGLDSIVSDRSA